MDNLTKEQRHKNMKNIKSRINQNEIINVLDKFMKGA